MIKANIIQRFGISIYKDSFIIKRPEGSFIHIPRNQIEEIKFIGGSEDVRGQLKLSLKNCAITLFYSKIKNRIHITIYN